MNQSHRKIITDMQASKETVHIVDTKDAEALANEGYVRVATIDPAPAQGKTAINLTAKGRGVGTKPTERAPATEATAPASA